VTFGLSLGSEKLKALLSMLASMAGP
jgi:hypothetical protein